MEMVLKNYYSQKGREEELKKFVKNLKKGIWHFRSDCGQPELVKLFRDIYFPESDYSVRQVNINKRGIIFFWSSRTNFTYLFNFITKEYLGVL